MKICPKCNTEHEKPGTFCSRKCANSRVFTEETNKRRGDSVSNSYKKIPDDINELRKKSISEGMIKSHADRGYTPTYCVVCNTLISSGNKHKMCGDCYYDSPVSSEARGHHYKKYKRQYVEDSFGESVLLMSSLEISYFNYLSSNKILWKKAKTIKYLDNVGTVHRYKPDFHLIENDEIIEVKGYWWNNDKIKMHWVMEQHPELKIKVLMKSDIELLGG